ncbi:MAG TPA: protein arginine N-methyltransferase [Stellaceae bacterium]|nr:protein arginine N-methyltransferase [Stellaceae bacterium]
MTLAYRLCAGLHRRVAGMRRRLFERADYCVMRGNMARDRRDWREAVRHYRRALSRRPDLDAIWIQYGHVLKENGQLADAEAAYRRAVAMAPHNADAHLQFGHLKRSLGAPDAMRHFAEALRRDASLTEARRILDANGGDPGCCDLSPLSLEERIARQYWWHSIDLGNGRVTPGRKSPRRMASEFANTFGKLGLTGRSVLDIGAWNGGFSVEAARRGAARVVALDHFTWNAPQYRGREAFDLVNEITGHGIEAVDIDLDTPQLSLSHLGQFDVVLFLGVFYHLRDPIAGLREAAALAREVLVVETLIERRLNPRPSMVFYPGTERAGDPTNWWGPNIACMLELLRLEGFPRIEVARGYGRSRRVFHAFRR